MEEGQDIICELTHLTSGQFKSLKVKPANIVQTKLTEIWKALNIPDYPIQVTKMSTTQMQSCTKACSNGKLVEKLYGEQKIKLKNLL